MYVLRETLNQRGKQKQRIMGNRCGRVEVRGRGAGGGGAKNRLIDGNKSQQKKTNICLFRKWEPNNPIHIGFVIDNQGQEEIGDTPLSLPTHDRWRSDFVQCDPCNCQRLIDSNWEMSDFHHLFHFCNIIRVIRAVNVLFFYPPNWPYKPVVKSVPFITQQCKLTILPALCLHVRFRWYKLNRTVFYNACSMITIASYSKSNKKFFL